MDLLDQIAIFRGCEPSVIISYIAVVREVYLHACTNLKKEHITPQERKARMLEQWKQIENHFAKIKYAMVDCWPQGNESDLMAIYVSIALLYSLYKEVCDERIIRQCYEAAERARRCGRGSLSESQFSEVQQYCDMIENIFFLRCQRSAMNRSANSATANSSGNCSSVESGRCLSNLLSCRGQTDHEPSTSSLNLYSDTPLKSHSGLRLERVKDGPALLAEYGQLSTVGKIPNSEKICQERLYPIDFQIKNAQKRLKYQKAADSVLSEFEAVLLARNMVGNRDFEFPRPSNLKLSRNLEILMSAMSTRCPELKPKLSDIYSDTEDSGSIILCSENLNLNVSDSLHTDSGLPFIESRFSTNQQDELGLITNISNCKSVLETVDAPCFSSVQDEVSAMESKEIEGMIKQSKTNIVWPKLESYANELVAKIIHSVIEVEEDWKKCSHRNVETIGIRDAVTSTVLTSNNYPVLKRGSVVMLSDENGKVQDGIDRNISVRTRRILTQNVDHQIENVVEPLPKTTTGIRTVLDFGDVSRQDKYRTKKIIIEDYAEMELSHNHMTEDLYDLQRIPGGSVSSDLSLMAFQAILRTSISVTPQSVSTTVLPTSVYSGSKFAKDGEKTGTDSVNVEDELSRKIKLQKLFDGKSKIKKYSIMGHLDQEDRVIRSEEKFAEIPKVLQKPKSSKEWYLSSNTEMKPIVAGTKFVRKQTKRETSEDSTFQTRCTIIGSKLLNSSASNSRIVNLVGKSITNEITAGSNQTTNHALTEQNETTALTSTNPENSLDDVSMEKLHYTPGICLMEINQDLSENLIQTVKKFDMSGTKSKSESLSNGSLFEKYTNFEPPSCKLQRVPEFDAVPLSPEQLQSKCNLIRQPVPNEELIPKKQWRRDQMFGTDNHKEVPRDLMLSSFEQTKLEAAGSISPSTIQMKAIAELASKEQDQFLLASVFLPSVSSGSHTTVVIHRATAPKPQMEAEEQGGPKSKSTVKKTCAEVLPSLSKDGSEYCQQQVQLETFPGAADPQLCLSALQKAATSAPCRGGLDEGILVSSRPSLPPRPRQIGEEPAVIKMLQSQFQYGACEGRIGPSDCNKTPSESEVCQITEPTDPFPLLLEKTPQAEQPPESKLRDDAVDINVDEEQRDRSKNSSRTIFQPENKLLPGTKESSEWVNDNQTSRKSPTPSELIQIPHFDARAEFDRRLLAKKNRRGEVPVIVKSATSRSDKKLSGRLTEDPLISSTLRLSASEKPDFNFIIKRK
uniref:Uncharacterized protein n=1 Tax=Setaria digitata TaxID=48799 RepID=A0A915PFP5_9BILA